MNEFAFNMAAGALVLGFWVIYTHFARMRAKNSYSLSRALHQERISWMLRMLKRDNRVADTSVLRGLEHGVIFFASSTLLVIGALLTILFGESSQLSDLTGFDQNFWFSLPIELKLMTILLIFVYAFFQFTWSARQYSFFSVLVGGAPTHSEVAEMDEATVRGVAESIGYVADRAGHAFNYGLRAWYFALVYLVWLVFPYAMVVSGLVVVAVLYRREFRSRSLMAMVRLFEYDQKM
jgi:uncharacterized membrane protein